MNTSRSFDALNRANPRRGAGFSYTVEAAAAAVHARTAGGAPTTARSQRRQRSAVRLYAVTAPLAAGEMAAFLASGFLRGSGTEDAAAVIKKAAAVTAASADRPSISLRCGRTSAARPCGGSPPA